MLRAVATIVQMYPVVILCMPDGKRRNRYRFISTAFCNRLLTPFNVTSVL